MTLLLVTVIGIILANGYWWIIQRVLVEPGAASPAQTAPASVRVKYSSSQTIEISSTPGNYNEMLNLDNVATLIYAGGGYDYNSIGLVQGVLPPLTIDEPRAGQKYSVDHDWAMDFPGAGQQGVIIKGARAVSIPANAKHYMFHRQSSPVNIVEVDKRRFRVTLQAVTDKSNAMRRQGLLVYEFGISEE